MKFKDWSTEFETGIASIDSDHQTLFNAIRTLGTRIEKGHGKEQIDATIESLLLYVDEHFQREERFLRQAGYPDFFSHKATHDKFRDTIFSLRDFHNHFPADVDGQKIVSFLENWLLNHILKTDKAYVPYLNGEKSGDDALKTQLANLQPSKKVKLDCPADIVPQVEHFMSLLTEGSQEGKLLEAAVEKVTQTQSKRRDAQAKKLFGK